MRGQSRRQGEMREEWKGGKKRRKELGRWKGEI